MKRRISNVVVITMTGLFAFMVFSEETNINVRPDSADFCYRVGDKAVVEVSSADVKGNVEIWVDDGWTNVVWRRTVDFAKEPIVTVEGITRGTPGVLRLHVCPKGHGEKVDRLLFDWRSIKPLTPCPDDFEAYWKNELARLEREIPIAVDKELVPHLSGKNRNVYSVSFATFNGGRVHGLLSVPKGAGPFPVCVNVPGAGAGPVSISSDQAREGWIALMLDIHGYPVCRTKEEQRVRHEAWLEDIRLRGGEKTYQRYGFGLGRDKPIYHDLLLGMVRAIDWLAKEPYADASRFIYSGGSQGGGFGIYLTAMWGRFEKSLILFPNMCDMLAYKFGRQPGSEHIMDQTPVHRLAAESTGPYYDACNFALMIRTPVRMIHGLSDTNCHTEGGIAAFNSMPSKDKAIKLVPRLGHNGRNKFGFDEWVFGL